MEKYSVLMSVYKKEQPEYLVEALDSMIDQTVKPDEIVLVEDGPLTGDLYSVIDKYCERYPSLFNIVINETNLGLGLALNKGLEACKNDLVARMDSDDISFGDRCEKQLEFLSQNADVSIVGGQIQEFYESQDRIIGTRAVPCYDLEIKKYMKLRCPFNHMTIMYKKSDILSVGNYRDFLFNEDYDLWIRCAEKGLVFANLSEIVTNVRVDKNMYTRRGGLNYFISEYKIQQQLLEKGIINKHIFVFNCCIRFIIQVLFTNSMRSKVYKVFARKN